MKLVLILVLVFIFSSCSLFSNASSNLDFIEEDASISSESSSQEDYFESEPEPPIPSGDSSSIVENDKTCSDANSDNKGTGKESDPAEDTPSTSSSSSDPKPNATKPTPDIKDYTTNYYENLPSFDLSEFYKTNSMLEGKTVDFNTVVIPYTLPEKYGILRNQSEFDTFLSDYNKNGKLWNMYCAQKYYFATASDGINQYGVTLIPENNNYSIGQVGGIPPYIMPTNTKLLNNISQLYDLDNLQARSIGLTRYLNGILLTDGNQEHFIVLESMWDFADVLKVNTIYPVADVVKAIEDMESIVVDNNE